MITNRDFYGLLTRLLGRFNFVAMNLLELSNIINSKAASVAFLQQTILVVSYKTNYVYVLLIDKRKQLHEIVDKNIKNRCVV